MIPIIFDTYLTSDGAKRPMREFYGSHKIDDTVYWFFGEGMPPTGINRQSWWTSGLTLSDNHPSKKKLSIFDFWVVETANACEIYTSPIAVVLLDFLNGPDILFYDGERVTDVFVIRSKPSIDHLRNVILYGKLPTQDRLRRSIANSPEQDEIVEHVFLGIRTTSGKVWGFDFTALQFGIKTENFGHYLHIERLKSMEGKSMKDLQDANGVWICDKSGKIKVISEIGGNNYATFLNTEEPKERFNPSRLSKPDFELFNILKRDLVANLNNLRQQKNSNVAN
jgi:hypothetical protein